MKNRPNQPSHRHHPPDGDDGRKSRGVVLLITLVILVILSTVGYTLSVQVAARRHRDRFIMDYARAQYACTSGMKHASVSISELEPRLISRPNEPDFSDVFAMTELAYQDFLMQAAANLASADDNLTNVRAGKTSLSGDIDDPNSSAWEEEAQLADSVTISGPYGARWPLVTEPVEFEIASAKVTVEIEDENAKYPLGWALLAEEQWQAHAEVGFVTFCEWMGYQAEEIKELQADLANLSKVRPFKVVFKTTTASAATPASLRSRVTRSRNTKTSVRRSSVKRAVPVAEQIAQQNAIFSRLFHSSLINTDLLARPSIASESRAESALKYLGLWGTRKVNVNTAPRHVLEAALTFGSIADAPKIAEILIRERQLKPFSDIEELKKAAYRYTDAIDKCKEFIVTESTVFTIRVTATSGVAKTVVLAGVSKDGQKVKRIAVISD